MWRWLRVARLRLRSLFGRDAVEDELDEELRYHLDRQVDEYVAEGMTPRDARLAALRRPRAAKRGVSRHARTDPAR